MAIAKKDYDQNTFLGRKRMRELWEGKGVLRGKVLHLKSRFDSKGEEGGITG